MAIVTLVGRPNVGKSSIFNRIIGRRASIVDDIPGVTRDRLYGEAQWEGSRFFLVDTGGIMASEDHVFLEGVTRQVRHAIGESQLVLFVLDGREGVTPLDEEIAALLRKSRKPVIVVMNKLDNPKQEDLALEGYRLGFERVFGVSAEHNRNFSDLLDELVSLLPEEPDLDEGGEADEADDTIRVTLVGRPNVGKSSLLNALLGSERALVSDVPGTTRDVVDSLWEYGGRRFRLIDTAGLRRKSRVNSDIEYYSNVRTFQAIGRAHIAVLLLDASEPVTDQDKRLAGYILERGRGLVLAVNKWDLAPSEAKIGDKMKRLLADELRFASFAPSLFISAKTGRGILKLPELLEQIESNRCRRIPTPELNRLVRDVLSFDRMPSDGRGKLLKINYCTQAQGAPPAFVFFVNDTDLVDKSFARHLENRLRALADFTGTPMRIFFRNKS